MARNYNNMRVKNKNCSEFISSSALEDRSDWESQKQQQQQPQQEQFYIRSTTNTNTITTKNEK